MAHPKIQRSLFTAGMATAMLAVPFGGSAFALAGLEDTVAPVTEVVDENLPAPVADAIDDAVAPVKEAVEEEAKPIVDQILEAAPEPVREAAGKVNPSQPPAGPVTTAPVQPAAPSAGGPAPVGPSAPGPVNASAPAPHEDASFWRARQALLSQPMTTSPFPGVSDLMATDLPMTAGADRTATTADSATATASGWLVATATGLLVALGAAHVAYADGRLSRKAVTTA